MRKWKEDSPEYKAQLLAEKYDRVSSSPDGIEVFEDLFLRLHLYDTLSNNEFVVLHNFAIGLLAGPMKKFRDENLRKITRAYLALPPELPNLESEAEYDELRRNNGT